MNEQLLKGEKVGTFSWKFCDRPRKALRVGERGFLLLPDNSVICEECYEGYGVFGAKDAYVIVAALNREYLSKHPDYLVWQAHLIELAEGNGGMKRVRAPAVRISEYPWYPLYADPSISPERFNEYVDGMEYRGFPMNFRSVGIEIAAYDEQNRRLPYPIKVANMPTDYATWPASKNDPRQGY